MRAHTAARDCATLYASSAPTPLSILGAKLVLDLDPDFGVSISSGRVTTITDQGPVGNSPTQATFGNQPTRVLSALDGHAAIHFNGSAWLARSGSFAGIAAGDIPTLYVIAAWDDSTTSFSGTPICLCSGSTNDSGIKFAHLSTTLYMTAKRATGSPAEGPDTAAGNNGVPVLLQSRLDASNTVHVRNGVDIYSRAGSGGLALAIDSLRLGAAESTGSLRLTGSVYRGIVANPAPSAAEHAAIMSYFKRQYPSLGLP